jgi:CBS domain-containing protein
MAALDPVAYVRATPPFHSLPEPLFVTAAHDLEIAFYPAGSRLVRAGGEPLQHLYVIRKGSVCLERDGQTIQVLEEGETFGYTSLMTRQATLDVLVEEDLLAYRLPDAQFQRLLADAEFAGHFAVGLSERLKRSLEHSRVATFQSDLWQEIQSLVRRPASWIGPEVTVGEAARIMTEQRISSLLVRTDPPGIVTDRDFRNRVLAEGLGPATPVTRVLSSPLRTVPAEMPVYQAWTGLLEAGSHHIPVARGSEIIGVITSSDLLKCTAQGPLAVLRRVERLASRDGLPGYSTKVAEMCSSLLASGLEAGVIAGFVARLNDSLLRRLVEWAVADLGAPPAPFAWLVLGSEGRMEQTLITDQDNALAYADEGAAHRDWFQSFADRIGEDLERAGFPPCPGGRMARRWHGTLSEWKARIEESIAERPHDAGVFFDLRRVAGDLDVTPLEELLAEASRRKLFVRRLARAALSLEPPATLMLRLRGKSSTVDLKLHGIVPVVLLARCYALDVGSDARGTQERLDAALRQGLMAEGTHGAVSESYRFLLGLRLRAQLRMLAEGLPVDNEVALSDLTAIERSRLKESFRAIKGWQEKAAYHYQTGLL